ncbi:MAG: helix-turn-helix transcriptional regulator [Lachnospiraceae bacterium]|nr:helix-turn-helix transcriptional regulator [Lachnospiraceae bacterium]
MTFSEQINSYMSELNCTTKELADMSGLSASVLSRYRSGSRVPTIDSEQFTQLVHGIVSIAQNRGNHQYNDSNVSRTLENCLSNVIFPYEILQTNFDLLLSALSVNVADLSHFLNFDSSYISRIRNGQRRPSAPLDFTEKVARYVVSHYLESDKTSIAGLLQCSLEEISSEALCREKLVDWLLNEHNKKKESPVLPFLYKLDEFDLNEFIRSIRFDELKVPSVPFQLPTAKNYYGIEEMCEGTLDFFKATVLSKSTEPLIANDDTPMADKAGNSDFMKKYVFAVAMTLKKGLHIHFIHNINRPFEEMMLGLEGWIPMYMTGQISPYYFKEINNKVFGHFLYSSGAAALTGECVMDFHTHGKMYLTKNKKELQYYRQRATDMLTKALPLMDIYRSENRNAFFAFVEKDIATPGNRRSILSALPIHTLSTELLLQIMSHNEVAPKDREEILEFAKKQQALYQNILTNRQITDEIPLISEDEFRKQPLLLPLSELFYEKNISYTYEEYLLHLEQTIAYSQKNENYTIIQNKQYPFRNIQIHILDGKWVLISKNKAPAIHFVIFNPQLRNALENMSIPIRDSDI